MMVGDTSSTTSRALNAGWHAVLRRRPAKLYHASAAESSGHSDLAGSAAVLHERHPDSDLTSIEEFRQVVELEKAIWGYTDQGDLVTVPVFISRCIAARR
jgi:hypothetical protein